MQMLLWRIVGEAMRSMIFLIIAICVVVFWLSVMGSHLARFAVWVETLRLRDTTRRLIPHQHGWEPIDHNSFKRRCKRCGKEQWLFEKRFPEAGEPKYTWRDMQ